MGVYSTVYVCIRSSYAQPPGVRAHIAELCHTHGLLSGECKVLERREAEPRNVVEWFRTRVLGTSLGVPFEQLALGGYADPSGRGARVLREGSAGTWMMDAVASASAGSDLIVWSGSPRWKDGSPDGGFSYAALSRPVEVKVGSAYGTRGSRFDPPDGRVGSFYDVLSLSMRGGPDGRSLARSKLVRQLKTDLGTDVTCRASHW